MESDEALKLAYKIKFERNKRNISQEELADLSGVSISTIKNIERGIGNITVKNLCKIAKILELDLGILTNFKL